MEEIRRIGRELKYRGNLLKVYEDTMEFPDGKNAKWDFVDHIGGAAVVPVLPDGRILLVTQFRNAADRMSPELPAGAKDLETESGEDCARRELAEETGYQAGRVRFLFRVHSMIAFCNEATDVYLAEDLTPGEAAPDETEFLKVRAYTPEELKSMIANGEITDSKTLAGLFSVLGKI